MRAFKNLEHLGSGSFGTVFRSTIKQNGKVIDVAVKRFDKKDPIFAENAKYEFDILRRNRRS